jgi:hypothetical protein
MFLLNQGEVCTCPSRALIDASHLRGVPGAAVGAHLHRRAGRPLRHQHPARRPGLERPAGEDPQRTSTSASKRARSCCAAASGCGSGRPRGRLLRRPDGVRGPQRDAHLPGGDLRARGLRHPFADFDDAIKPRQRHALRPRRGRVVARHPHAFRAGAGDPRGPGVDQLLPPVPGARVVRRLQELGHRPREPPHDARPLPADQERARSATARSPWASSREQGSWLLPGHRHPAAIALIRRLSSGATAR